MRQTKDVTIYDIAQKLNISAASVSRGLKDDPSISKKTRKRIRETADELGYRTNQFARNLRSQKTSTIGVIVPRLNSNFMSAVIAGIENVVNREGYNLLISQSSELAAKEALSAKTMFNSRVDGLLISLAYDTQDLSHFEPFFKKGVPVVFFDRVMDQAACTNILIDNRKAAYEATKHLVEQGCKRIVHITAPLQQNVYKDRFNGYKQALLDNGLPFRDEQVLIGNLSQEAGAAAVEKIIKMKPLPDGIFAANDNCAVGCLLALQQKGYKIPDDIAVVGFNNDPVSMVIEPNLSTVNYPGYEMGEVAARHLIHRLKGTSSSQNTSTIVLRSDFIERASSQKKN
jgi:LacI family transcriptional regulator